MRLSILLLLASGSCSISLFSLNDAQAQAPASCFQTSAASCPTPVDIPLTTERKYDELYKAYAELAWQDFLSLNFPVNDPSHKGLSSDANGYVTQWLTYISAADLFPANGGEPRAYNGQFNVPEVCKKAQGATTAQIALTQIVKGGLLDEYVQANRMGPVVDQSGQYLRFGIGFNDVMYKYVYNNKLYSAKGQREFDSNDLDRNKTKIEWPYGNITAKELGSIFVKSAWKILNDDRDKSSDFYTTNAYIYTPQSDVTNGEINISAETCEIKKVGLVGLHIVHRTPSAPQWVWATFEHKRNAPWIDEFKTGVPTGDYSLFNPKTCLPSNGLPKCGYNQLPAHPWDPTKPATPSEIVRMFRPGLMAAAVNDKMKSKLDALNAPWKNYFLVDVQFPTLVNPRDKVTGVSTENPAYPDGAPTPTFLANSTMETYVQGFPSGQKTTNGNEIPPDDTMQYIPSTGTSLMHGIAGGAQRVTSSCMSCHYDATMVTGTNSNFVFSLSRAK